MPGSKLFLLTLLSALFSQLCLATATVDIYQPSHKPAQTLIDILSPLYPNSKFSNDNQQIIIRGEAPAISQIQELLLQLDHPPRRFQLEISDQALPANSKTYSSGADPLSQQLFLLEENSTLTLGKSTESQQLKGVGLGWLQVESKPLQQEFIRVKVQAAEQQIYLQLELQLLKNDKLQTFSNTISGPANQWLAVNGGEPQAANLRQWSTTHRSLNQLFIRVREVETP